MSAIRVARVADAGQVLEIYAPNVTDAFVSFELLGRATTKRPEIARPCRLRNELTQD